MTISKVCECFSLTLAVHLPGGDGLICRAHNRQCRMSLPHRCAIESFPNRVSVEVNILAVSGVLTLDTIVSQACFRSSALIGWLVWRLIAGILVSCLGPIGSDIWHSISGRISGSPSQCILSFASRAVAVAEHILLTFASSQLPVLHY